MSARLAPILLRFRPHLIRNCTPLLHPGATIHTPSSPTPTSHETEMTFRSLSPLFRTNSGHPAFRSLERLGPLSFTDVYLDTARSELFNAGIYLRLRDGVPEAKMRCVSRRGGSSSASTSSPRPAEPKTMIEAAGWEAVTEQMSRRGFEPRADELREVARFSTRRERWFADEDFMVVMDKTDFGYAVGEVERLGPVAAGGREVEGLLVFMRRYAWAFGEEQEWGTEGKLTAYFERFGCPEGLKGGVRHMEHMMEHMDG